MITGAFWQFPNKIIHFDLKLALVSEVVKTTSQERNEKFERAIRIL